MKQMISFSDISKKQIGTIVGGFGFLGFSLLMGFGGFDYVNHAAVTKMVRLEENSRTWRLWKSLPVPIYLKIYIFNITNPEGIANGEKAVLNEVGPYVYLMDPEKYDLTTNPEEATVRYRNEILYYFLPELSNGDPSDKITIINAIFLSVAKLAHDFTDVDFLLETLDDMLSSKGEKLTITCTVGELLFEGISIKPYVDLLNDPIVQNVGDVKLPDNLADGKFGLLKGKNGTDDGFWEVRSGIKKTSNFGQIVSWNGKTKIDVWRGEQCNMMNGTDGTIFQAFIKPGETVLQFFAAGMCRTLKWVYEKPSVTHGVPVAVHNLQDFLSVQKNPSEWCFCPKNQTEDCNINGIGYLAPCMEGAPLLVSKPHFLNGDQILLDGVVGLNPKKELHESFLDNHSPTGATVEGHARLQFAIELVPWPAMPSFRNASHAYFPLLWIEQAATLDDVNIMLLKVSEASQAAWPILRWVLVLAALGIIGLGGFSIMKGKRGNLVKEAANDTFVKDMENSTVNINESVKTDLKAKLKDAVFVLNNK